MTKQDLYRFHARTRVELPRLAGTRWSCYFCKITFPADSAVDERSSEWHCPQCRLNTVAHFDLSVDQLDKMFNYWFEHGHEWPRDEKSGRLDLKGLQTGRFICFVKPPDVCWRCETFGPEGS